MKIKYSRRSKILIIATLALVSVVGVVALAKYVYQRNKTGTVKAKAFYFTSNLLEDSSQDTITTYKLSPETETIEFTLGNHDDKLRYSDVDINYAIELYGADNEKLDNNDYKITITDENNATSQTKLGSNGVTDNTIKIEKLEAGKTYTIKAIGYSVDDNKETSYHKTLTAKFEVQTEPNNVYKWLDTSNSEYVLLTVWSQGQIGNVTIKFPNDKVIPDNTDIAMRDVETTVGSFTDSVSFSGNQNYSSHVYRFFRSNGENIGSLSVDDFTVTYNNGTEAVKKQPQ